MWSSNDLLLDFYSQGCLSDGYAILMSPNKDETGILWSILCTKGICRPIYRPTCRSTLDRYLDRPSTNSSIDNRPICRSTLGRYVCRVSAECRPILDRQVSKVNMNPKQLSMAATTRVIWLCACVRYWPYRRVSLAKNVWLVDAWPRDRALRFKMATKVVGGLSFFRQLLTVSSRRNTEVKGTRTA